MSRRLNSSLRPALLAVALATSLLAHAEPGKAAPTVPTGDVSFNATASYPESMVWAPAKSAFFVGSVHEGLIGKVTPDGRYTVFARDAHIISSVGIQFDARRNLVWAAIADPGVSLKSTAATTAKLAAVAAYDATSGERKAYVDLGGLVPGAHFANDLALDPAGNVYVTDSFSPLVYKVDTKFQASVFATSELFKGDNFNLNGIAYHPDGYLLVGKHNSGEFFRINVKNPKDIHRIQLPEALKGADGFLLRDPQHLAVVQNYGPDRVLELVSRDGWNTATVQPGRKTAGSFPSAVTVVGKSYYVLNARLDTLFDKDAAKVNDFLLQRFDIQ